MAFGRYAISTCEVNLLNVTYYKTWKVGLKIKKDYYLHSKSSLVPESSESSTRHGNAEHAAGVTPSCRVGEE